MRLSFFLAVLVATFVASIGSTHAVNPILDNGPRRLREIQEDRDFSSVVTKVMTNVKNEKLMTDSGKLAEGVKTAAQLSDDQAAKLAKILSNPEKARTAFQVSDDEIARMTALVKKANADGGIADDEVAKFAMVLAAAKKRAKATDDQVFNIAKMMANAKKTNEAIKASDDEVRKVSDMFKTATGGATGAAKYTDDEVTKLSQALAGAQQGAALTDKQVAKVVKMFTEARRLDSLNKRQTAKLAQELAPVAVKDKKSWSTLKKVIVATLGATAGAALIYAVVKLTSSPATTAPSAAA